LEESHLAHLATLREQIDLHRRRTQQLEKEVANLHSALAREKNRSKNLGNLAATAGAILLGIGGALPSLAGFIWAGAFLGAFGALANFFGGSSWWKAK
jgi:hypothetical protein